MERIVALAVSERVRMDARRRDDILNELGQQAGQDAITAALEQLAIALTGMKRALIFGDLNEVIEISQIISRLACQVGLLSLAAVAMDLGFCAERDDPIALTAVHARLQRVGDASLVQIWDPPRAG